MQPLEPHPQREKQNSHLRRHCGIWQGCLNISWHPVENSRSRLTSLRQFTAIRLHYISRITFGYLWRHDAFRRCHILRLFCMVEVELLVRSYASIQQVLIINLSTVWREIANKLDKMCSFGSQKGLSVWSFALLFACKILHNYHDLNSWPLLTIKYSSLHLKVSIFVSGIECVTF